MVEIYRQYFKKNKILVSYLVVKFLLLFVFSFPNLLNHESYIINTKVKLRK